MEAIEWPVYQSVNRSLIDNNTDASNDPFLFLFVVVEIQLKQSWL